MDKFLVKAPKRPAEDDAAAAPTKAAKEEAEPGVPPLSSMETSWRSALAAEFSKPYFVKVTQHKSPNIHAWQLMAFLAAQAKTAKVYPPEGEVYGWSQGCRVEDVKVVVIGQDPYHGAGQAHGLCFSVKKGVKAPPSLVNVYKELQTDISGFRMPGHGYLQSWAAQGVLLLNAVLTVREKEPNSHADKGWETFTDAIISHLNTRGSGVVFMLWGAYAQKKGKGIDKKKHLVLEAPHPSPLAGGKFFGCKHFSKANEYLASKGKAAINWDTLADAK